MKKIKISYSKKILLSILAIILSSSGILSDIINANDEDMIIDNEQDIKEYEQLEKDVFTEETSMDNSVYVDNSLGEEVKTYEGNEFVKSLLLAEGAKLKDVFPDANFRLYIAENILGLSSGSYDENYELTEANINKITTGTTSINVNSKEIYSLDGIEYFVSLEKLYAGANKLSGNLDLSMLTKLTLIHVYNNQLTSLQLANLKELTALYCYSNELIELDLTDSVKLGDLRTQYNSQLSVIRFAEDSKSNFRILQFHFTNIDFLDLDGFNSLTLLTATKTINANIKALPTFYLSGSRLEGNSIVRLTGNAGAFEWDKSTGYYVINSSMNAKYSLLLMYFNENGEVKDVVTQTIDILNGALLDNEGNLILGATLDNIINGKVILENGGTIITGGTTYDFDGYTEVSGVEVVTKGSIQVSKNTTDGTTTIVGERVLTVEATENKDSTINLNGSAGVTTLPAGSIITRDNGDAIYVIDEVVVSDSGTISSGSYITVPKGTTVTENEDGTVTIPENMVVTIDGEDTVYPGEIIFNTSTGKAEYLPISGLITEDEVNGTNLGANVTDESIKDAEDFLETITEGKLKDQLQNVLDTVKDMLEASKKVDNLYDELGNLKEDVSEEMIKEVEDTVNNLPDGTFKEDLLEKVEDAQDALNQRNEDAAKSAVDDLFNEDKTDLATGVGQIEINDAQKVVDKLPEGSDLKGELQKEIDKAQELLDAKEQAKQDAEEKVKDLFNPDGTIKDTITQDTINDAQKAVDKLSESELKDNLQDKINEAQRQLDEKLFVVIENFATFTGKGTVSATIDADIVNFSKVYVNGKLLAASNYVVTSGSTVITLNESYLLTLANGTYNVEVEFVSGAKVSLPLTVNVKNSSPSKTPSGNLSVTGGATTSANAVNTADTTDLNFLYGLLATSLLGLVVLVKRRKEIN